MPGEAFIADGFVDDYPSRLPVLCLSFASRPLLSICPILCPILCRSPLVCCSEAKQDLATTFSDGDLTRGHFASFGYSLLFRIHGFLATRLRNAQGTHDRPYAENLRGKINSIPHSADMVKALLGFNSAEGMIFETRAQAEAVS
ncbi:hypothetical protein CVT26_002877 [Gymnopilus dilepis]|uniref:Uncharacterized protein n=1 Tax=Gymnopilus dilepis TaxID=231916 RepID=A0A409X603_9AGAR|nr:hypothetical protein CVT26_002877 [Gymnopilus dilepis]